MQAHPLAEYAEGSGFYLKNKWGREVQERVGLYLKFKASLVLTWQTSPKTKQQKA